MVTLKRIGIFYSLSCLWIDFGLPLGIAFRLPACTGTTSCAAITHLILTRKSSSRPSPRHGLSPVNAAANNICACKLFYSFIQQQSGESRLRGGGNLSRPLCILNSQKFQDNVRVMLVFKICSCRVQFKVFALSFEI